MSTTKKQTTRAELDSLRRTEEESMTRMDSGANMCHRLKKQRPMSTLWIKKVFAFDAVVHERQPIFMSKIVFAENP